jgi:hypothetical protein
VYVEYKKDMEIRKRIKLGEKKRHKEEEKLQKQLSEV